jgi:integrase
MASISREPNGRRRILFTATDGKRKTIRLGKTSQKAAEAIKAKVETIISANLAKISMDDETSTWLGTLDPGLHRKLAAVGLVQDRGRGTSLALGEFLQSYIEGRSDVKPNTRRNLLAVKARLVEFFGAGKSIQAITPADADAFLVSLREKYANGTTGRTVKRAQQFFRKALRSRAIRENPFQDVKPPSQVNAARNFFVTPDMARRVLEACPDVEWRLIFALSRYGGLRCPSEHFGVKWTDVDWERDRMLVHAPKTEHHEDGGERWIPLFPELRVILEEAFDVAQPGTVYVINRYRDPKQNLRTQLLRIIRRAGLLPWPKLFQNLRATRETELAESYPIHVVCAWIGNTELIAAKHYLQVTEEHFQQGAQGGAKSGALVAQNPALQPAALTGTKPHGDKKTPEKPGVLPVLATGGESLQYTNIPPRGLEPLS